MIRCLCGYVSCCETDFDEHVVALTSDGESHHETSRVSARPVCRHTVTLHWRRTQPGLHAQWETEEQRDGTPDFLIVKQGLDYRLKSRTARQWSIHDTLQEAKDYAESWGGIAL